MSAEGDHHGSDHRSERHHEIAPFFRIQSHGQCLLIADREEIEAAAQRKQHGKADQNRNDQHQQCPRAGNAVKSAHHQIPHGLDAGITGIDHDHVILDHSGDVLYKSRKHRTGENHGRCRQLPSSGDGRDGEYQYHSAGAAQKRKQLLPIQLERRHGIVFLQIGLRVHGRVFDSSKEKQIQQSAEAAAGHHAHRGRPREDIFKPALKDRAAGRQAGSHHHNGKILVDQNAKGLFSAE